MPYEFAEKVIESHTTFALTNCVCRQEMQIIGKGCGKPLETCMSFGGVADYIVASGQGRRSSRDEMLTVLKKADEAGLVLSPANSKEVLFFCACCGDCCGVLRTAKLHPKPASIISSPYTATLDDALCSGCGTCVDRCQMEAITVPDGVAVLDADRCIGCGLCVSTCTTGALSLVRKPESEQRFIPKDVTATNIKLAQTRGLLSNSDLVTMMVRSKIDRLFARM
jgi:ferredoxin